MGDLKGLGPWFVPVVKGQGNSGQGKDSNRIWCPRTGSVQLPGETAKPTAPGSELGKVLAGTVGNICLQCGFCLHTLRAASHQSPCNLCHVPPLQHRSPPSFHSQSLGLLRDSDLTTPSDQGWQDSSRLGDSASKPLPRCPPLCLLPSLLPAALPSPLPAVLPAGLSQPGTAC